jgi:hypothetical protein
VVGAGSAGDAEAKQLAATLEELVGREEELAESCVAAARMKDELRRAMLAGAGASGALSAGGPSTTGFDAPRLAGAAAANLGTVGCGVMRVTPLPAATASAAATAAAAAPALRRIAPVPAAVPAVAPAKRPAEAAAAAALPPKVPKAAEAQPGGDGCKQQ